jgi:mono/diheme cytochrome c family protein
MVCHSRAANFVLGPSTLQMNRDHDYGGVAANQLAVLDWLGVLRGDWRDQMRKEVRKRLKEEGLSSAEIDERMPKTSEAETVEPLSLGSLSTYPRLVDPYDPSADVAARVRSYLHANCAQCHVEAGGGNAQIDLEFTTALDKMRLVDEPPLHHRFDLPDARLVAPGAPDRSVLVYRMAHRGPGQMPQLATVLVDEAAVALVREWIDSLR